MEITSTEKRVIELLLEYGKSPSAFDGPIHAVDRAMRWTSADTRKFVDDLEARGLIVRKMDTFNRLAEGAVPPLCKSWWERPE